MGEGYTAACGLPQPAILNQQQQTGETIGEQAGHLQSACLFNL